MRHYEVVFLVHPDQSDQVPAMIEKYRGLVEGDGGAVHRVEDWGRRQLAYQINRIHKAHFVMMNIECNENIHAELESIFRFNDSIIRSLFIRRNAAETEQSPMMAEKEESDRRDKERAERNAARSSREDRSSDDDDDSIDDDLDEVADDFIEDQQDTEVSEDKTPEVEVNE